MSIHLTRHLESINRSSVLCIGDVMLDRFVYGSVERISPEAPIPVVHVERETAMLGGAGNVVRNIVSLGGRCHFISVIGDDQHGLDITRLLNEPSIDSHIIIETGRPTTVKTRIVASAQQLLRTDRETTRDILPKTEESIYLAVEAILNHGGVGAIILSDYKKGVLTKTLTRRLIELANGRHLPIIIDPKGRDYEKYRGATILTPNRKELHEATNAPTNTDEEILQASRSLIERHAIQSILATRSQDGMSLVSQERVYHMPTMAREVYDVSGAGDTVIATLATLIANGVGDYEAAQIANFAAGIVVGKTGTAVTYKEEIISSIHLGEMTEDEGKILSLDTGEKVVEYCRHKGKRVGFTNGCFDLLHPGHISLLTQAKAECDFLVVGINSDASVARLKGPTRPIQNEISRATVLSSLKQVDVVIIFDQDTPLELIERLKPDVLVKGADYTIEGVVGASLVKGWGGEVILANLIDGQSTTLTIKRMQA